MTRGPSDKRVNVRAVARRWPLATAGVSSGILLIVAAILAYAGNALDDVDPNGGGPGPYHGVTRILLVLITILVVGAFVGFGRGVGLWLGQHRTHRRAKRRRDVTS